MSWEDTARQAAEAGIDVLLEGEAATVALNRPDKRNSQTPEFWAALAAIGAALPGTVRVVVLRSEGKSFSAGLDRSMFENFATFAAASDEEVDRTIEGYQEAFTWWRRTDLVTVAAVQGHAIGAGFQLALACDIRVVADDVLFSMKEPALGLVPDLAGTQPLVDAVGYSRALEIVATARYVDAEESLRIGLANHVVPRGELHAAAAKLAADLLANPRGAVTESKALLRSAAGRPYDEQRAAERAAQTRRFRDLAGTGES
ncbi:enoyl-CoA hydratase/carnithine racemase [Catenulispora sp. GAS73]|uniref:enoyl-CoA hydratase/isomerase family protein n=1 Tax=Catenulispora sp. GAS73 TaxID=3156269 RepID=UPI003519A506